MKLFKLIHYFGPRASSAHRPGLVVQIILSEQFQKLAACRFILNLVSNLEYSSTFKVKKQIIYSNNYQNNKISFVFQNALKSKKQFFLYPSGPLGATTRYGDEARQLANG